MLHLFRDGINLLLAKSNKLIDSFTKWVRFIKKTRNRTVYTFCSWVEQDPKELFEGVISCLKLLEKDYKEVEWGRLSACGITNQRESVVAFRKSDGIPICNAISWMDVRTVDIVGSLKSEIDLCKHFEALTGLKASTFFSAFKMKWILENVPEAQKAAHDNDLAFCTIDSWILWKLTSGTSYYTDPSNASRTFLFSLESGDWCHELLNYFGINVDWLPEIKHPGDLYGSFADQFAFSGTPITALVGDQQASILGHWGKDYLGKVKCTFGTGAFLLRSIDSEAENNPNALRTVIIKDHLAEEYPIVCAGSLIKWLQDSLNFFDNPNDLNHINLAPFKSAKESVYFVPNLSGSLFPKWDPLLRGSFHNISLQSGKIEMTVAVLESVAFCIRRALENFTNKCLSVDGGMCSNMQFCQLLSNICNCSISKINFYKYSLF